MDKEHFYSDTFFARQPIFTDLKQLYGYELLYRHSSEAHSADFDDEDIATLTVISNAVISLPTGKDQGKRLVIHFTEESIRREIPLALPAASTIVLVDETLRFDAQASAALARLKNEGFGVAVNNFTGAIASDALLTAADMVFIDMLGADPLDVVALVERAKAAKCIPAAKRVEDKLAFEAAKSMGFVLFQGFFFQKPEIVPGRKLTSTQMSRLMLFKILEDDDADFDELAKVIQADVSISYRLLSFINSAAFGFSKKIESIKHAIILLGWRQIKSWLWLVILTDITPDDKTSELPHLSAIRGKFLERTAANSEAYSYKAESLYLLGLFSLLEPMLDMPMSEIARNLPLDDDLKAALSGEPNEYADWLNMARTFERGEWDKIDGLIEKLKLDPMSVAGSYAEALAWAKSFQQELA